MFASDNTAERRLAPAPDEVPARVILPAQHRGFTIVVTATRRVTGVTLVVTEVAGGPAGLKRNFYTISPERNPQAACEHALAEICAVLDQAREGCAPAD
jgi:hypothetical protein